MIGPDPFEHPEGSLVDLRGVPRWASLALLLPCGAVIAAMVNAQLGLSGPASASRFLLAALVLAALGFGSVLLSCLFFLLRGIVRGRRAR